MNLRYAVKSWVQATSRWRWHAALVTALKPDAPDSTWTALAAHREAIKWQADGMAAGLDQAASVPGRTGNIARGLAALIRRADAETDSLAGGIVSVRAYPAPVVVPTPGQGGLGQAVTPGAVMARAATVWTWVVRAAIALGILAAAPVVLPMARGVYTAAWRAFVETEPERRRREMQEHQELNRTRREDLEACKRDPDPAGCTERTNDYYDAFAPCKGDILDTPIGSTLGTLVGIGGGYVGMKKIMGWAG